MNIRNHVFATAVIALVTAFATGTAFAIASSGDHNANQSDATNQAMYPSNQAMGSSDQSIAAPGESSEQSSQTYGSSNQSAPSSSTTVTDSYSSGRAIVTPTEPPAVVGPSGPEEPRYTPETGDAEYGPKLDPNTAAGTGAPGEVSPPPRFNDATGQ
jgi:hypothetical protein